MAVGVMVRGSTIKVLEFAVQESIEVSVWTSRFCGFQ